MMLTVCSFVLDDGICACVLDRLNWQCASRVMKSSILNFVCNALQLRNRAEAKCGQLCNS